MTTNSERAVLATDVLKPIVVKKIESFIESIFVEIFKFGEGASYAISQCRGQCLLLVASDQENTTISSMNIDVPMDLESAHSMLDTSLNPSDFAKAIIDQDKDIVNSFVVSYLCKNSILLEEQVQIHNFIADENSTDSILVILGPSGEFVRMFFFPLGERIDFSACS
ncbi:MAG: hypothetical protein HQ498_13275 [Pseudohongiella sp.]|nr:hypothetical protein [Pseudohongiella sp.]